MELAVGWWMCSSHFCQVGQAISLHVHVEVTSTTMRFTLVIDDDVSFFLVFHVVTALTENAAAASS